MRARCSPLRLSRRALAGALGVLVGGSLGGACRLTPDDDDPPPIGTLYGDGDPEPPALACDIAFGDPSCAPPQLLIVLDRSTSMAALPDGSYPASREEALAASKWTRSIEAIERVTGSELGARVSFGLEVFPRDPGLEDFCVPLADVVGGMQWSYGCREGALLVAPCPDAGAAIAEALDVTTTTLCGDTPMAAALDTAAAVLAAMRDPSQAQYVLFVTDGADSCAESRPAVEAVEDLAASGVGVFAVGFAGGAVDPLELGAVACAGGTAPNPEVQCGVDVAGHPSFTGAGGVPYLVVEDGPALEVAIRAVAEQIECTEIY